MGLIETIIVVILGIFGIRYLFKGIINTGLFLLIAAALIYILF